MGIEDITLPDGRVWVYDGEAPRPVDKQFGNDIFKVLESYALKSDKYVLKVNKNLSRKKIDFKIAYNEGEYYESVSICEGEIVHVESCIVDRKFIPKKQVVSEMSNAEIKECLDHWLSSPIPTPEPQYIKIKDFESELCFLPWRVELDALFKGSGYFGK